MDSIKWFKVDLENNPKKIEKDFPQKNKKPFEHLSKKRNQKSGMKFPVEEDKGLQDFYTIYKPWEAEDSITKTTRLMFDDTYTKEEKQMQFGDKNYYQLYFSNAGGLVMPIIIEWTFEDGTKEIERIPVEIWRKSETKFSKVFVKNKEVLGIVIDPFKKTADVDEANNNWPVKELPSRFQVYKSN